MKGTNLLGFSHCKFGVPVPLVFLCSPLRRCVAHVVESRTDEEVCRIDASTIVAVVTKIKTEWNMSADERPAIPVGAVLLSFMGRGKAPVAGYIVASAPFPAPRRQFLNQLPEALNLRNTTIPGEHTQASSKCIVAVMSTAELTSDCNPNPFAAVAG